MELVIVGPGCCSQAAPNAINRAALLWQKDSTLISSGSVQVPPVAGIVPGFWNRRCVLTGLSCEFKGSWLCSLDIARAGSVIRDIEAGRSRLHEIATRTAFLALALMSALRTEGTYCTRQQLPSFSSLRRVQIWYTKYTKYTVIWVHLRDASIVHVSVSKAATRNTDSSNGAVVGVFSLSEVAAEMARRSPAERTIESPTSNREADESGT